MKKLILMGLLAATVFFNAQLAPAAEPSGVKTELDAVITQIQDKLKEGKRTEADLADHLKQFDAILAKHKGEKTEELAQVLFMKAVLYLEIFEDTKKGAALIKQLKAEFPETKPGKNADKILASIEQQEKVQAIQNALAPGSVFPDFSEKDLDGNPLSLAKFKGKVVLVDFWATWCGPCVGEIPNVLKTYEKHHTNGFEVIGISLDEDKQKLTQFIKTKKMPWPQYFDGLGWKNKLATKYGVNSIPATFLIDRQGKIIGKGMRGEELETAVAKALAAK